MKTKIVFSNFEVVKTYNFLITMSTGDVVDVKGVGYRVRCCLLEVEEDQMLIVLDK
jgi:hypothetical protein